MNNFTITYRDQSSRQHTRTTTAPDAKSAVANVQVRQRYTKKEVRELVSVKEWPPAAHDSGEFVRLSELEGGKKLYGREGTVNARKN